MDQYYLTPLLPEIVLLSVAGLLLLVLPFMKGDSGPTAHRLSVLTLLGLMVWFGVKASVEPTLYIMSDMFVADPVANVLKAFGSLAMAVTLVYSRDYLRDRGMLTVDFYAIALLAFLGQCVMISGNNFLTLYLGLELLALSSYTLVAFRRDSNVTSEAAMKYFILGALASGFLLYGMSMLYGATGSLELAEVFKAVGSGRVNSLVLVFGVVFLVAGLAFKLGAVPFHMWVPDVYQGSPTAVTLLIAGAPKLAAFALTFRLLVEGLLPLAFDWQQMLAALAVMSLIVGNLTAIPQTNLKRMLAYSTMSHMGFMLLGLLSGVVGGKADGAADAYSSAMFYAIIYVVTTLGVFGILMMLSRQGFEAETLDDLKGLNQRSPWYALLVLFMMFSLAGVPPTAGFYAKLSVLQAVVDAGMIWLAVLGVITSLIGAFYYLRVVKVMYFDAPISDVELSGCTGMRALLSVNGIAVLLLGVFPASLMTLCLSVMRQTLAS
jgi:NADH-quinone oxidoreductase subunit N